MLYLIISILLTFQSSSNGVTVGTPKKATITILSNDNAFGIIAFNSVRNFPSTFILSLLVHQFTNLKKLKKKLETKGFKHFKYSDLINYLFANKNNDKYLKKKSKTIYIYIYNTEKKSMDISKSNTII